MAEFDEKRQCSRTEFLTEVFISFGEDDIQVQADMLDISILGMFVETTKELQVGRECEIRIEIVGCNSKLLLDCIHGVVVRSSDTGVAIRFLSNMEWFVLFKIYSHYSKSGTVSLDAALT